MTSRAAPRRSIVAEQAMFRTDRLDASPTMRFRFRLGTDVAVLAWKA